MGKAAPRVVRRTRGQRRMETSCGQRCRACPGGGIKIQGTGMMGRFVLSLDLVTQSG